MVCQQYIVVGKPDIGDECRVDNILVTILDTKKDCSSALAWRLTVEDDAGREFTVKIWHTHDVGVWWREGWQYILTEGRGKHRNGDVILHSTTDFAVTRPDSVVDLLVIGDSHIGRETRPDDFGAPYETARQFVAAMGYAARYDVDAVLNAGDLFDDNPNEEAISVATSGFAVLAENDIPFYFVYGNHGTDVARRFFDDSVDAKTVHLGEDGHGVGHVDLFGIDYESSTELSTDLEFNTYPEAEQRLLLIHNEIDPPRADTGYPVEKIAEQAGIAFDCIFAGHLHAPESATSGHTMVQHLGSTADISAVDGANDESAWLVRSTPSEIDINRLQLD